MLFHTHIFLGIIFFLVSRNFFSGGNQIIFFLLILLGSILPDIDSKHSKINKWFGFLGNIVTFFAKHRGLFHSLILYIFLFFAISFFTKQYYAIALTLGYFAHIIGDGMTIKGVQIFYPFSKFTLRGPIKVGGFAESIILVALFLLIIKFLFF